jgi:hypothetical protein
MLVLLKEVIYEAHHSDGLRWHDKHTKFHEDRPRHSKFIILWRIYRHTAR